MMGLAPELKADFSPKQVARAIGVSESSLKRWCDCGVIPSHRTSGGHRRLPMSGVVKFLRDSGRELILPETLGLPATLRQSSQSFETATQELREFLLAGQETVARDFLLGRFLGGERLSILCDEIIAPCFQQIGEGWEHGSIEIYQERRSCEAVLGFLHECRHMLPPVDQAAVALGGTFEGDHFTLPTTMIELVLRESGFRACSLGTNLPCDSLVNSLKRERPSLFWMSVSTVGDRGRFLENWQRLYRTASDLGIPLVVGGQALTNEPRRHMQYSAFCDCLQHLEAFLENLKADRGS